MRPSKSCPACHGRPCRRIRRRRPELLADLITVALVLAMCAVILFVWPPAWSR